MKNLSLVKTLFAILLLMTVTIRPIHQFGMIAYYQLNIDYIVDTYCVNTEKPTLQCNGKCYLSKQLQLDTSNAKEEKGLITSTDTFFPVFFKEISATIRVPKIHIQRDFNWKQSFLSFFEIIKEIDRPPQFF